MENCKNCKGWLSNQRELDGYEGVGFCVLATLFNIHRNDNILVLHEGERHKLIGDHQMITYAEFGCAKFEGKAIFSTAVPIEP